MKRSADLEREAAQTAVALMAGAARTAPKGRGIDNIETIVIDNETDRNSIAKTMRMIAKRDDRPSFERDAGSIAASTAILIIGVRGKAAGLNCAWCGFDTCEAMRKAHAICAFNAIDLGIATGSAVAMAGCLHADNRIMYSIGVAAIEQRLFSPDVRQALGIPLSVTGKNPFFDRK